MPRVSDPSRCILAIAAPVLGGMVSQNLLNLVDSAMIGSLGDVQLAAVGVAGVVFVAVVAALSGLSSGVQCMAARRTGQGRPDRALASLASGLALGSRCAVPMCAVALVAAPEVLALLIPDPSAHAHAVPYLQLRFLAIAPLAWTCAFRGYWAGVSAPRVFLRALLVMHASNIALNWLLIFGHAGFPELGAAGAGLASALSTAIGAGVCWADLRRRSRVVGGDQAPTPTGTRAVARQAVPAGLQRLLFSLGLVALFAIVARVGTAEAAAAGVLVNLTLVAILPALAFGIASASLVGQALGRGDVAGARRWATEVLRLSVPLSVLIGLPMLLAPHLVLGVFLAGDTLELAVDPLRIIGATIFLDGVSIVLRQSLLGAGASRQVLFASALPQWIVFLPAALLVGPVLGYGLLGIWFAQLAHRVLQVAVYCTIWRSGRWSALSS